MWVKLSQNLSDSNKEAKNIPPKTTINSQTPNKHSITFKLSSKLYSKERTRASPPLGEHVACVRYSHLT